MTAPRAIHGDPVPEAPEPPRFRARPKNTRRWCHGKVGVEHQRHWQPWGRWYGRYHVPDADGREKPIRFWEEVCTACGKHLNYCCATATDENGRIIWSEERCVCPPGKGHRF